MSMPIHHLPVVQKWDCHSCAHCCREYDVAVTKDERARIEAQAWSVDPAIGDVPLFVRMGPIWSNSYRLNHRKDRGCIFLSDDNRCKIHEKYGAEAKPLACRLYPFALVPVGEHWRVSLRYACPSAAGNRGTPFSDHAGELNRLASEYEQQQGITTNAIKAPPLQSGQSVEWPDLLRFVNALQTLMSNRDDRIERRWRKCLALAALCRQAKFDAVKGKRLSEFLGMLIESLEHDVPRDPAGVAAPGWVGRMLFRQLAAMYGRKDRGELRGLVSRGRLALLRSGWQFARGRGAVPRINARINDVTFAQLEEPAPAIAAAAEEMLERYYLVKLNALQFCGRINFGLNCWDGLDTLAVTYPLIIWLARAICRDDADEAVSLALQIVDDHFGYNPILKTTRFRVVHRTLSRQGELAKLVAWYGAELRKEESI